MTIQEMRARELKVSKLVDALLDAGISSGVAATLDDTDWAAVARLAKCHPPHSDPTKRAVIERMEQIEHALARKRVSVPLELPAPEAR